MATTFNYFDGSAQVEQNLTAAFFIGDGSLLTNIEATDVKGVANYMPYFDNTGSLQSEQYVTVAQGGVGQNFSANGGLMKYAAGVPSVAVGQVVNTDVAAGANIAISKLLATQVNKAIVSDASGNLTSNSYQTVDASGNVSFLTPAGSAITLQTQTSGNVYIPNGKIFMDTAASSDVYDQVIKFTTTNATVTPFAAITLTALSTLRLTIEMTGFSTTSGTQFGSYYGTKACFCPALTSGATFLPATQSGAAAQTSFVAQNSGLSAAPLSFTYAAPVLTLNATGILANNINWTVRLKYQRSK